MSPKHSLTKGSEVSLSCSRYFERLKGGPCSGQEKADYPGVAKRRADPPVATTGRGARIGQRGG